MQRTYISLVIALATIAGTSICGEKLAFAQDGGTPPPPADSSQAPPLPPPPSGGTSGAELPPTMPSPPSGGGEYRPPEMMGRPPETGTNHEGDQYRREFEAQYSKEVSRQIEQRTKELQQRYAQPPAGGEFRGEGRPMMDRSDFSRPERQPFPEGRMQDRREFGGGEPPGSQGGYGGDRGFGGGMMGGEEDAEENEKRMEEREKMMRAEQLKQMKRGMVSGIEQGLKQIKRMMDRLSKKGIAVPSEAQALVSELSSALETLKAATELTEAAENAMEVLQDKGHDLGEIGQKLGMLEQLSQMTKQVEKEFARIEKELAKARATKEAKQYPDTIAKIEADVSSLRSKWEGAKSEIAAGDADPDELQDIMEEVFSAIQGVRQSIGILKQLRSVSKMIKSAEKEVGKFDKEIARQKKAGKDVSKLVVLLGEARAKLGEITTLAKERGFDPEDLFDLMQELERIRNQALDELDRITGKDDGDKLGAAVIRSLISRRLGQ